MFFQIKINLIDASSMEPCLTAQSVRLSDDLDPNIVLPIDCQCNNNDLICIDLNIYNDNYDKELKLPNLAILFKEENNSLAYILPKQRFSFFGYKKMVPNAFDKVKFVSEDNHTSFNDQKIFIDIIESSYFPTGTFSSFGNLAKYNYNTWPNIFISIVLNENTSLTLEDQAIANMSISILSFEYAYSKNKFNVNSLLGSCVENLIIKNSDGFTGFSEMSSTSEITIHNIAIDKCFNFVLNNQTIPSFEYLESITITNSNLDKIENETFINFKNLKYLNLKGNLFTEISSNAFEGISSQIISLDLSYNPIVNLDWNVFDDFDNLTVLDLSYTNISTIDSSIKEWPQSQNLESIALNGYVNVFTEASICSFDTGGTLNLSNVLIELDPFHDCNCFVFYIYKNYRLNPNNNVTNWLLANRTPICYRSLFAADSSEGFGEIEARESACFLEDKCSTTQLELNSTLPSYMNTTEIFNLTLTEPEADNNTKLSRTSVIVIISLAVLSFVLLLCLIFLIVYLFRQPNSSSSSYEEYYRV